MADVERVPEAPRDSAFAAAIKDACIAALIAMAMAAPVMGLPIIVGGGDISLEPRWWLVGAAGAAVFAGRLLFRLVLGDGTRQPIGEKWFRRAGGRPLGFTSSKLVATLAPAAVVFAVALPFIVLGVFPQRDRQLLDLAILVMTYIMLGWGLNIVVGLAGLLDLGYVAFYAVGAYSFALLAVHFDLGFWICLPLAGILAAFWGIILGFPVLRLRGDYLAIVTLAFGEIIRVVLLNWYDFTNGPDGISGIPRPTFFGLEFRRGEEGFAAFFGIPHDSIYRIIYLYYIVPVLALVTNFVTIRMRKLPMGRAWEALREDEIACRSLGISTVNTKLTAFAIGAMFGGFAGSFFATRQGFISPESFTFLESAIVLAIVVLGGMGSQLGIVLAAILIIGLPEIFRELEQYRMLVFGMAMVGIMTWRPRGLLAHREPSVLLHGRKGRLRFLPDRPARPAAGELRS